MCYDTSFAVRGVLSIFIDYTSQMDLFVLRQMGEWAHSTSCREPGVKQPQLGSAGIGTSCLLSKLPFLTTYLQSPAKCSVKCPVVIWCIACTASSASKQAVLTKGGCIGTHRACTQSVINPISLAGFILLQEKLLTTRCVIAVMQYW